MDYEYTSYFCIIIIITWYQFCFVIDENTEFNSIDIYFFDYLAISIGQINIIANFVYNNLAKLTSFGWIWIIYELFLVVIIMHKCVCVGGCL